MAITMKIFFAGRLGWNYVVHELISMPIAIGQLPTRRQQMMGSIFIVEMVTMLS